MFELLPARPFMSYFQQALLEMGNEEEALEMLRKYGSTPRLQTTLLRLP